jgi:hypothetical protein
MFTSTKDKTSGIEDYLPLSWFAAHVNLQISSINHQTHDLPVIEGLTQSALLWVLATQHWVVHPCQVWAEAMKVSTDHIFSHVLFITWAVTGSLQRTML